MRKTLFAILLALALVLIPAGNAFAATSVDVTVTATPAVISFTVVDKGAAPDPPDWEINCIENLTGTKINRGITYFAHSGTTWPDDVTGPSDPVIDDDCWFTFENDGDVTIQITCDMEDFGAVMTNSNTGFNGAILGDEFGASGYASGVPWSAGAIIFKTVAVGSDVFIASLASTVTIDWGVALMTQPNSFEAALPSSTITCTALEI